MEPIFAPISKEAEQFEMTLLVIFFLVLIALLVCAGFAHVDQVKIIKSTNSHYHNNACWKEVK